MISSEVTVLFEKACQSESAFRRSASAQAAHLLFVRSLPTLHLTNSISLVSTPLLHSCYPSPSLVFIQELTARSHLVSLASRRRTLSRPDVAEAVGKSDMFDFLIDIIPRDDSTSGAASGSATPAESRKGRKGAGKGKGKKRSRKASAEVDDDDGNYGEEDGTPMGSEFGTETEYVSVLGAEDEPGQHAGKKARIDNLVHGAYPQVSPGSLTVSSASALELLANSTYKLNSNRYKDSCGTPIPSQLQRSVSAARFAVS